MAYFGERTTPAHLKMADAPSGAVFAASCWCLTVISRPAAVAPAQCAVYGLCSTRPGLLEKSPAQP